MGVRRSELDDGGTPDRFLVALVRVVSDMRMFLIGWMRSSLRMVGMETEKCFPRLSRQQVKALQLVASLRKTAPIPLVGRWRRCHGFDLLRCRSRLDRIRFRYLYGIYQQVELIKPVLVERCYRSHFSPRYSMCFITPVWRSISMR